MSATYTLPKYFEQMNFGEMYFDARTPWRAYLNPREIPDGRRESLLTASC